MPRQIKEINNFNLGIILNSSEKDTPEDAASFSLNINPISENGILDSINADRLVVDIGGSFTRLSQSLTWGENDNSFLTADYNNEKILIEDYKVFNNKSITEFQFVGVKGKKEKLTCWNIQPYWEKAVSHTTPLIFKPSTVFAATSDYITYSENANSYGAATTITVTDGDSASSFATEGQYITLISTDGTTKNYVLVDDTTTTVATGDVLSISSDIGSDTLGNLTNLTEGVAVAINLTGTLANQWKLLDQLEDAIEGSNGHNGAIVVTNLAGSAADGNQSMTVTQAVAGLAGNTRIVSSLGNPTTQVITIANSITDSEGYFRGGFDMDTYFEIGDYISFAEADGNPAFDGIPDFEIMQINDIDTVNSRIYFTRNCFGTKNTLLTATATATITITDYTELNPGDKVNLIATDGTNYDFVEGDQSSVAGTFSATTSNNQTATNLMNVINTSSGPSGTRFTATVDGAVVTVTQATSGAASSTTVTLTDSGTAGMSNTDFTIVEAYWIYSNRITIDGVQQRTHKATCQVYGWSDYSGNHLGSSAYHYKPQSATANKYNLGALDLNAANRTVVFSNTNKTVSFDNGLLTSSDLAFVEGDTVNFYASGAYGSFPNHGFSATIVKKEVVDTALVWTLDTAPTDETTAQASNFYYIESNLIKNFTFHHSQDTAAQDTGTDKAYKINDWVHYSYWVDTESTPDTMKNYYQTSTSTDVAQVASGGYWEDTNVHGSAVEEVYYPFVDGDRNMKIISQYGRLGNAWKTDGALVALVSDIIVTTIDAVWLYLSKNDIIKIDNEYMLIQKIQDTRITVERGYYDTTIATHADDSIIYKIVNHSIRQEIPKASLVQGQRYRLTFFAKGDNAVSDAVFIDDTVDTNATEGIGILLTDNAKILQMTSTANIRVGMGISGSGITSGSFVTEIISATLFRINKKVSATATDIDATFTEWYAGRGAMALTVNGGYFDETGRWKEGERNTENGFWSDNTSGLDDIDISQEQRWIPFTAIGFSDGDTPKDDVGNNTKSHLDNVWRKFTYTFELPSKVELKTDLRLEFASRGKDNTVVYLDLVDLNQDTELHFINENISSIAASGLVDNGDKQDLVVYDSVAGSLAVVSGFDLESQREFSILTGHTKSVNAAAQINSSNYEASIVAKNRELHIGFGGKKGDTPPQWIGYTNHKVFGRDYTGEIYQDEDTVPKYGGSTGSGKTSLDKICLAGESDRMVATWNNTSKVLTIEHDAHFNSIGDNIIVREWGNADNTWTGAGVWTIITASFGSDAFGCKRATGTDKDPVNDGFVDSKTGTNGGYISYRPFYYYGCKDGDPYIYRITPEDRFSDASPPIFVATDPYIKGTIEKSVPLGYNINSICTYHNKDYTDGDANGGRIYALSATTNQILVLNVNLAYNKWTEENLSIVETFEIKLKSLLWSNDSTTGDRESSTGYTSTKGVNIKGDMGRAAEVSPTVVHHGVWSDILETKGPTSTTADTSLYAIDDQAGSDIPERKNFDTRLWIQARPEGDSGVFYGESRYLFCAKTEDDTSTDTSNMYFADRTPAGTRMFGCEFVYDYQLPHTKYYAGPGPTTNWGDWHGPSPEGASTHLNFFTYFWSYVYKEGHTIAPAIDYLEAISARSTHDSRGSSGSHAMFGQYRSVGFVNFGDNVGWEEHYAGSAVNIKVAKYGLFAIADNDGDGVLDGTGVVVPTTKSITTTGTKNGPYGNMHQRVCSHAVGLIASSNKPWVRNFGKMNAENHQFFYHNRGDYNTNSPEHLNVNKFVFVVTDMHSGDSHYRKDSYSFSAMANVAASATHDLMTEITLSTSGNAVDFQAGDIVYVEPTSGCTGNDWGTSVSGAQQSLVIHSVDETNGKITVPLKYGSTGTGKLWPMSVNVRWDGITRFGSAIGGSEPMYHFAFRDTNPLDGGAFTYWQYGSFLTRHFYSPPSYASTGGRIAYSSYNTMWPGFIFPVEKLNYRSGFMLRPFMLDDDDFDELVLGTGLHVDVPSMPDTVYHKQNGTYLNYSINDASVNNQFASKLFITTPLPTEGDATSEESKIYVCDSNFMFPTESGHQRLESVSYNPIFSYWTNNGRNSDVLAGDKHWDIFTGGTAIAYYHFDFTDTTIATAHFFRDVIQKPVVEVAVGSTYLVKNTNLFEDGSNYGRQNHLHGLCLSIVDDITGNIQTRYVVASKRHHTNPAVTTSSSSGNMLIQVHYPFQHAPHADDNWFLWKHKNCVTSPIRLYKSKELTWGLGTALKADPIISKPIFKDSGAVTIAVVSLVATVTCTEYHNLNTNEIVRIKDASTPAVEETAVITVTSPTIFTYTTTSGNVSGVTATWELVGENITSNANPLTIDIGRPVLKTTFGGLDMRKTRTYTIDNVVSTSSSEQKLRADANHLLVTGDTITYDAGGGSELDGTYHVDLVDPDQVDITTTRTDTDTGTAYTNQFESVIAETSGTMNMGELRTTFNSWDRGDIAGNVMRYDRDTAGDVSVYINAKESSLTITPSSAGDVEGDFFLADTSYYYRVSLMYDGYQEGPLSNGQWLYTNAKSRSQLSLKIKIKEPSRRLSAVCIYRKDNINDHFKLVKQISTTGEWRDEEDIYSKKFTDKGQVGASYEARTGLSEVLDTIQVKYGISKEIDGFLFVGDCSHQKIENASNMVFRSKPGMFSIFDYANDFQTLKSKPTALVNFNGRLYAFDSSNIYRINQHSLTIEDVYEGIGCLGKNSVVVTEYGMFFADRNGAYFHNGSSPQRISEAIHQGGDLTKFDGIGTDNIVDLSWTNTVGSSLYKSPKVIFDADTSSVLFVVDFTSSKLNVLENAIIKKTFIWSYNIPSTRWDLWELVENEEVGIPFLGKEGEILIPIGSAIYHNRGSHLKRDYTWISKKITIGEDSIVKVFNKVKLNGITTSLIQNGSYKESSDRLLLATSSGAISNSDIAFSTSTTNYSSYKVSGSNKKGRWLQIKLEDMTEPVDSLGVIFRRKSTK